MTRHFFNSETGWRAALRNRFGDCRALGRKAAAFLKISNDPLYTYRRVTQIFFGAEATILLVILVNLLSDEAGRTGSGSLLYIGLLAVMVALHATFTIGSEKWALRVTLWTSMATLTMVTWADMGLRDQAFIAYGIVLVMSATLETRLQYGFKVANVLLNAVALGYANDAGWIHPVFAFGWPDVSDVVLIYGLLGYAIGALSGDLRQMVERYRAEVDKVGQREAEILRMVHHDLLTGLPNRLIAERDFESLASRSGGATSVFFIDLDHFKAVNDTLGHAAGDQLLKTVTERLSAAAGPEATLCRIGGDEFLIVTDHTDDDAVQEMAERIRVLAGEPVSISGRTIMPTFSIGIARCPRDGDDFETLSRKADIALYSAKAAGRNMYRIYDETMNSQSLNHIYMNSRLSDAILNGEMQVYYQPKISLKTGQVDGAEALLRWFPKGGEPVSPDEFIPLAESSGLIDELGRWVLEQACHQCRVWQRDRFPGLKISVNVSAVQFRRGRLEKAVRDALDDSGLDPASLELELTESILLQEEFDVAGQIARIRALGVTFSIDDFGKGYSNLGYLGKLDIATLKIDRHFVAQMMNTERDKALVGAIFAIAKALNLKTVAEGVENEESMRALKAFGCSSGQGFYWSRPVEPAEFEAYAGSIRRRARRA